MKPASAVRREQCRTRTRRIASPRWLLGLLVAIIAVLACFAAAGGDGAVAAPGARAVRESAVPAPGSASQLLHVACTSASNCWAVGAFRDSGGVPSNQALHWNGTNWSQVVTPNPGGAPSGSSHVLDGVACTSASNCWAVGEGSQSNTAPFLNVALHWNGTRWLAASTPEPGGTSTGDTNELLGVSCTSASNCWAVGETQGVSPAPRLNQILHWNGTHWSQVSTPEPGGTSNGDSNLLGQAGGGVTCASASNCWAVGYTQSSGNAQLNEALHWNGTNWSKISTPEPGNTGATSSNQLDAVTCASASNCSAVGKYYAGGSSGTLNQVLHWSGHTWVIASVVDPGGEDAGATNDLLGVACPALTNCFAVGSENTGTDTTLNEALHWTGGAWLGTSAPEPGGVGPGDVNELAGVTCPSTSNCWAVGLIGSVSSPINEILHWNGHSWLMG